jgi:hypothetical protein
MGQQARGEAVTALVSFAFVRHRPRPRCRRANRGTAEPTPERHPHRRNRSRPTSNRWNPTRNAPGPLETTPRPGYRSCHLREGRQATEHTPHLDPGTTTRSARTQNPNGVPAGRPRLADSTPVVRSPALGTWGCTPRGRGRTAAHCRIWLFTWPTHCESSADVHRCDLDEPGEADSGCSTLEVSASAFAGQAVVVGVQARLARSTVSREAARCDLSLAITTPDATSALSPATAPIRGSWMLCGKSDPQRPAGSGMRSWKGGAPNFGGVMRCATRRGRPRRHR